MPVRARSDILSIPSARPARPAFRKKRIPHQHVALQRQRAQRTNLVPWAEGPGEQAVTHQLLQPLTVQNIALAVGDILDVSGVDQISGEVTRLEKFVERNPVHARRFHRYGVHFTSTQPVSG